MKTKLYYRVSVKKTRYYTKTIKTSKPVDSFKPFNCSFIDENHLKSVYCMHLLEFPLNLKRAVHFPRVSLLAVQLKLTLQVSSSATIFCFDSL